MGLAIVGEFDTDAFFEGFVIGETAEHDVADGEAFMPEEDAFGLGLAAGFEAGDDFADFAVDVFGAQFAGLDETCELAVLGFLHWFQSSTTILSTVKGRVRSTERTAP